MTFDVRHASIVWLVCLVPILFAGANAFAGDRVVVVNDGDPVIQKRVIEELNAVGFDAKLYEGAPDDSLEMIAEQASAAAVVRLARKGGNIEVWVADRVTNKTVFRSLEVGEGKAQDTVAVIAAVELLRASLMELHAERPPAGKVMPKAETQAFSKPKPPPPKKKTFGMLAALGLGGAMAGLKTGIGMRLPVAVTMHAHRLWYLRLNGAFFLFGSKKSQPEGDVRYEPWFGGAEVGAFLNRMRPPIYPFLGVGGGASMVHVEGHGKGAYLSNSRWLRAPVMYGRVGANLPVGRYLLIQASIAAGMALKTDRITVMGKEAARLGRPLIAFDLMLGFVLW